MIVVLDESADVGFKLAGQIVVHQQDAVSQGLMPALDLALGLWMVWRAPDVIHALFCKPSAAHLCGLFLILHLQRGGTCANNPNRLRYGGR